MAQNPNRRRLRPRYGYERGQFNEDYGDYLRRNNSPQEQNELGEKYGNNYGFGREGELVAPQGYSEVNNQQSDYVYRYNPPRYRYPVLVNRPSRTRVEHRSDRSIHNEVCERLKWHGQVDASEIQVEVQNQEVTLQGTISDRNMKKLAERVAESVPGVEDVHNRLQIQNQKDTGPRYEQGRRVE